MCVPIHHSIYMYGEEAVCVLAFLGSALASAKGDTDLCWLHLKDCGWFTVKGFENFNWFYVQARDQLFFVVHA